MGRFEFQGVSLASGDVGGDLIDVVESKDGWIGYVADVSGHGVGAGLLMGMVKSATHMQLQVMHPIDQLLTNLNTVLLDLKKPEMYVTFAGLQFDGVSVFGATFVLESAKSGLISYIDNDEGPITILATTTQRSCDWASEHPLQTAGGCVVRRC